MSEIASISAFLRETGTEYRIFDMGRRIQPLDREEFERFEAGEIPWPAPLQQSAWLGVVFWDPEQTEADPYIWFLRFPLDEFGKLQMASRDQFLRQLLDRVGENVERAREGGKIESALKDNPFVFTPKQDRLAVFHAKAKRQTGGQPSRYYEHAREYFAGEVGFDQWAFLGIQGVADVAARLDEEGNEALLAEAIPQLPPEPLEALGSCLENESVGDRLAEALAARLRDEVEDIEPVVGNLVALIRGISHAENQGLRRQVLVEVLESDFGRDVEVLAAIAGRCWEDLEDEAVRNAFLEALARNPMGQEAFNNVIADLLFIPGLHRLLLDSFRRPERSAELGRCLGRLFESFQGAE